MKKVALVLLLGLIGSLPATSMAPQAAEASDKPNILFILTDDLDVATTNRLMGRMPYLRDQVRAQGTAFNRAYVTIPTCCPSRASMLTGQYAHNHTVYTNYPSEHGGAPTFRSTGGDQSTIATWLDEQGYQTILIGKYLNYYDGSYIPPGWDQWIGQIGSPNNDYKYNINGTTWNLDPTKYHDTDVFRNWAANYIRAGAGKNEPFFMYLSVNAPHVPDNGAPRHAKLFRRARIPQPPNFNEANVSDKPPWIRNRPRLNDREIRIITKKYRDRLRSMISVDQMIGRLIGELRASGELNNTYIVFSSDHGFHLGQHRLRNGKGTAYEEDIRVPLYVRGPGVPAGRTLGHKVLGIDFAPTFAELGGAQAPAADTDGRSLVPLLGGTPPPSDAWRESFMVELFDADADWIHPFSTLRTDRYSYIEYNNGERELYDMYADPYQLNSLHRSPGHQALIAEFHTRLEALKSCSGQVSCKAAESGTP